MSSSYYEMDGAPEKVRETVQEKVCSRCRGTGSVELHGQETDCIECEGWGSVLI